ncbi:hypothetical protein HY971_00310 [Candidatus Kaiserbacteria bacterium]|nr:hypothetical protein [Candidatus Kaiserbacteria bacterium]
MSIFYPSATSIRVILALIGFLGIFFAPWWVPLICIIALSLRYPAWEVPIIGLLMDLLWLPGEGFQIPLFLIGSIALVWVCAPLRSQFLRP